MIFTESISIFFQLMETHLNHVVFFSSSQIWKQMTLLKEGHRPWKQALKIKASLENKPRAYKGHTGIDFLFSFINQKGQHSWKIRKNKTKPKQSCCFWKIFQTSIVSSEQICSWNRCADTRQIKWTLAKTKEKKYGDLLEFHDSAFLMPPFLCVKLQIKMWSVYIWIYQRWCSQ